MGAEETAVRLSDLQLNARQHSSHGRSSNQSLARYVRCSGELFIRENFLARPDMAGSLSEE